MTDDELTRILETGGKVPVPYFDGATLRVEPSEEVPLVRALPALKAFLSLTPEQRLSDARHLVAYCRLMMDAVGEEEVLSEMGGAMPAQIWDHAHPTSIFIGELDAGKYAARRTTYVQVEGRVAWEPEHGLQMSWAEGSRLVKVGAFDGHPTNGHASAKPEHDRYVFRCYIPELCTLPDAP